MFKIGHEAAIQLEFADRQAAQIAEAGVAGAEIIHGQAHAMRMHLVYGLHGAGVGVQQNAFRQLQGQVLRSQVIAVQRIGDHPWQIQIVKARWRQIDRHCGDFHSFGSPLRQLAAGLLQCPAAQVGNQPALFGQRDEAGWRNLAQLGMGPARQGLHAIQTAGGHFDLRLIVQAQAAAFERLAQCSLQCQTLLGQAVHFAAEETETAAPLALGLVHGHVGAVHQGLHIPAVHGKHCNAHAGRYGQRGVGNIQGLCQQLLQAFDGIGHMLRIALRQHGNKLVTRQTPGNIAAAQHALQSCRDIAQQFIPHRMAQRVIDLLEPVQVDEQHRQLFVIAGS